jgi:gas vesicle protein
MNKFVNFVAGAALGAIVGVTAALFLAPVSGAELQTQIRDQVERIQIEVKTAATDRRTEMEEQLNTLRQPRPAA